MKKRQLGIIVALAGILLAGTAQAVELAFDLDLPMDGSYSNATVIVSPQSFYGATFDLVYTIDSIAAGSNSFARSTGTQIGVGSDADLPTHYTTIEGDGGEGLSFAGLSISNFVANASGIELSDIADLRFTGLTVNNAANTKDGIAVSFTDFGTNSVNFTLYGGGVTPTYTLDLTALANYTVPAPDLFIKNDSANSADRWAVAGLIASVDASLDFNLPPVADEQSVTVFPDAGSVITLTGSDPEGSNLTYNVVDYPTNGLFVGVTNSWTYTPTNGYQGADSFTFTVNDGDTNSEPATVSITVTNEVPIATAQSQQVFPDTDLVITLAGTDPDGGPSNLTYIVSNTITENGGSLSGDTNTWTYTPPSAVYEGADSFTFAVFDGYSTSIAAIVSLTVTNELPVANDQSLQMLPDTNLVFTLSANDPDNGPSNLTYIVDTSMLTGSLSGTAPELTYTPTAGYTGTDSFTYTVNDGLATSAMATVTIEVLSTNAKSLEYTFETPANIVGETNNIVYSAPDVNSFGAGVTVSVLDLTESDVNYGRIAETSAGQTVEATVCDRGVPHLITFDITIDDTATLDLTSIKFDTSYRNNFRLATNFDWTFYTIAGGVTNNTTTGGYQAAIRSYATENSGDIALTGLSGLTDTTVTFVWSMSGQRNNVWTTLAMGLDDVVLLGTETPAVTPTPVISSVASGGDLIFSWEGGYAFDVLTNANLALPNWGVAIENASSPVTNAIGGESRLFYKLSE
ncbi:Ig-like domain-containing protein [Pontiellaceae bacterium B12227]|nr:Ig-like domain-containing protein [Pontiellaceae bacterium B12227]